MRLLGTAVIVVLLLLMPGVTMQVNRPVVTAPSFSANPLIDMGTSNSVHVRPTATYKGLEGGLYENGSNQVPKDHDVAGLKFASQIAPINGKIVLLSIGMSNAIDEWGMFLRTS